MAAEEVLLLGPAELSKVFDEVNFHLENCIEKLLMIKVELLSDQSETKEGERSFNGSECNHRQFGNNFKVNSWNGGDGKKEECEDSKHAIEGSSSVRSSPSLEPSSPSSQPFLLRHCSDDHGDQTRQVQQQTNQDNDHYYLEGLRQKEYCLSTSTTTSKPSCISNTSDEKTNFAGDLSKTSVNKVSNNSFEEQEYAVHSGIESADPSQYAVNSINRKHSLTTGKPPITSSSPKPEDVISCQESNQRSYPQLMMKSYSNEEIVFRMADERKHQELGHVPQEHNWTDYSARLSLPTLDPPEHFRDNVSTNELAPPPTAYMVRTPELVNITTESRSQREEMERVVSDIQLVNVTQQRIRKQDSNDTKTTTTSSCDKFDTASSDIYFSQDGYSPPDQSLSDSPPLFVPTVSKPPLASSACCTPSYRKRNSYPKINIPIGINLSIRISHVNDPTDFWIHVNRDQVNMLFNEIQLLQEKFVQSNHVAVRMPIVGSMYATRYSSDVSWYRAEVIELLTNSYVSVLFIDYGYTVKLNTIDLAILSPLLEDKPAQAFNCFLKGVQPPSGKWTPSAVDEFKNSVSFYSVRAIFHDVVMDNHRSKYPVDLFLDWGSGEMNNVLLYLSPTEFITNELNM